MAQKPVTRRTALKTLASVAVGTAAISTVSATDPQETDTVASGDGHDAVGSQQPTTAPEQDDSLEPGTLSRTGVFDGTVDRIVDGQHVVILVEEDGRIIQQVVESRDALPTVGEGDPVRVFLLNGQLFSVWPA